MENKKIIIKKLLAMCLPNCPYCPTGKQFNFSEMSLDFLKERYNFLKVSLGEIAKSLSGETDREVKNNLENGQSAQRSEFCEIQDELYLREELSLN